MEVKICPNCGVHNLAIAWICKKCDQDLRTIKITIICPRCGSENAVDEVNCRKCQFNLNVPSSGKAISHQNKSQEERDTTTTKFFWVTLGAILGMGVGLNFVNQHFTEFALYLIGTPILIAALGGLLGLVIGAVIDNHRRTKKDI
jgi:ribosomal protein L40E